MPSTAVNNATAIAIAVKEASGGSFEPGSYSSKRNSTSRAAAGVKNGNLGSYPAYSSSLPSHAAVFRASRASANNGNTAIAEDPSVNPVDKGSNSKPRMRRASERSRLSKSEAKRSEISELNIPPPPLRYNTSTSRLSSAVIRLWEHTPEWSITSKLLISKHQQVQMLEAASVLVAITKDGTAVDSNSDSASPAASGSSDAHDDGASSNGTSPPPQIEDVEYDDNLRNLKRFSTNSSSYSRSYQSTNSVFSEGPMYISSQFRQGSTEQGRPTTSATSVGSYYDTQEDQADLAAAVGLLSCSYGTPMTKPIMLSPDVPPVPALPEKYLSSSNTYSRSQPNVHRRYESKDADVDMDEPSDYEDDRYHLTRGRSDEDEGVFGKMED
ncbi:hypothetical protein LTS18_007467 [Coniosporium uncinatum]|uniref:Uncharacterized protein n=1 Tax=Coniosporium uncinatum TaxID=93489 RepID=A0ACC3D2H9_9PEZI|nr:hypothetical protein LTS18_007467 [Coniosporium uncinatum]